jgi:hypothetical protein
MSVNTEPRSVIYLARYPSRKQQCLCAWLCSGSREPFFSEVGTGRGLFYALLYQRKKGHHHGYHSDTETEAS